MPAPSLTPKRVAPGASFTAPPSATSTFYPTPPLSTQPTQRATPSLTNQSPLAPLSSFKKGVAYTTWRRGGYLNPASDQALEKIVKPMGVTWITLLVTCYQEKITSTQIICNRENTPSDEDLAHAIHTAHQLGIRVMLKPHLDLSNDPTHWRGEIGFGNNAALWKTWFEAYTSFITHYAELGEQYRVDEFCVGTELVESARRAAEWRAVIREIRTRYRGPLIYATNHGEEDSVTWWDALDEIGVDAYYPLTNRTNPSVDELKTAWKPLAERLKSLAKRWNKPVIFTEIGYRSIDGTNRTPWDYSVIAPLDLQEQADCYQAVFETFAGQDWWGGVFWWNWEADPNHGGPVNRDYTANGKPAENVLRKFYGAPLRPTPAPTQVRMPDEENLLVIYHDSLGTGWEDWSWGVISSLADRTRRYNGDTAIRLQFKPWGGLSLHHPGVRTTPYHWLEFWVMTSNSSTQRLAVFVNDEKENELRKVEAQDYTREGKLIARQWQQVRIPLADLSAVGILMTKVNIQEYQGGNQPELWIDEIRLLGALP